MSIIVKGSSCKELKSAPQRTCVVCRRKTDKKDLLRVVCDKEGFLAVEEGKKLAGRGAYIHSKVECIVKAGNLRIWQKVFKRSDVNQVGVIALKAKLEG